MRACVRVYVRVYMRVSLLCPCAHDQLNGTITISGIFFGARSIYVLLNYLLNYLSTYNYKNTVNTHLLYKVETNMSAYYSDVTERKKMLFHIWTSG